VKGLEQLKVLIGEWAVASKKYPEGRGRTTVAATEDGRYLRLESTNENPLFPKSTMLIGTDDDREECGVLYYDSRDVRRVYRMTLASSEWRIWREAPGFNQRFTGKISSDGMTITAQWEMSEDGKNWKVDFDLTYTKVATGHS
jgi:hypothetical protein